MRKRVRDVITILLVILTFAIMLKPQKANAVGPGFWAAAIGIGGVVVTIASELFQVRKQYTQIICGGPDAQFTVSGTETHCVWPGTEKCTPIFLQCP